MYYVYSSQDEYHNQVFNGTSIRAEAIEQVTIVELDRYQARVWDDCCGMYVYGTDIGFVKGFWPGESQKVDWAKEGF